MQAEVFTLANSEEILKQQESSLSSNIKQIERKQGITVSTGWFSGLEKHEV